MKDDSLSDVNPLQIAQNEMNSATTQYKAAVDRVNRATDREVWALPEANKLKDIDIEKLVSSETSVYAREIWNKAIETAANVAEINSAAEIRKLKKWV